MLGLVSVDFDFIFIIVCLVVGRLVHCCLAIALARELEIECGRAVDEQWIVSVGGLPNN